MKRLIHAWRELGREAADLDDLSLRETVEQAAMACLGMICLIVVAGIAAAGAPS